MNDIDKKIKELRDAIRNLSKLARPTFKFNPEK